MVCFFTLYYKLMSPSPSQLPKTLPEPEQKHTPSMHRPGAWHRALYHSPCGSQPALCAATSSATRAALVAGDAAGFHARQRREQGAQAKGGCLLGVLLREPGHVFKIICCSDCSNHRISKKLWEVVVNSSRFEINWLLWFCRCWYVICDS